MTYDKQLIETEDRENIKLNDQIEWLQNRIEYAIDDLNRHANRPLLAGKLRKLLYNPNDTDLPPDFIEWRKAKNNE